MSGNCKDTEMPQMGLNRDKLFMEVKLTRANSKKVYKKKIETDFYKARQIILQHGLDIQELTTFLEDDQDSASSSKMTELTPMLVNESVNSTFPIPTVAQQSGQSEFENKSSEMPFPEAVANSLVTEEDQEEGKNNASIGVDLSNSTLNYESQELQTKEIQEITNQANSIATASEGDATIQAPNDQQGYKLVPAPKKVRFILEAYNTAGELKYVSPMLTSDVNRIDKFYRLHGVSLQSVTENSQNSSVEALDKNYDYIPMLVKKPEGVTLPIPLVSTDTAQSPISGEMAGPSSLTVLPEVIQVRKKLESNPAIVAQDMPVIPAKSNPLPVDVMPIPPNRGPEKSNENLVEELRNENSETPGIDNNASNRVLAAQNNSSNTDSAKKKDEGKGKKKEKKIPAPTKKVKQPEKPKPATSGQTYRSVAQTPITQKQTSSDAGKTQSPAEAPMVMSRPKRASKVPPPRYAGEDFDSTPTKRQKKMSALASGQNVFPVADASNTSVVMDTRVKTTPPPASSRDSNSSSISEDGS